MLRFESVLSLDELSVVGVLGGYGSFCVAVLVSYLVVGLTSL